VCFFHANNSGVLSFFSFSQLTPHATPTPPPPQGTKTLFSSLLRFFRSFFLFSYRPPIDCAAILSFLLTPFSPARKVPFFWTRIVASRYFSDFAERGVSLFLTFSHFLERPVFCFLVDFTLCGPVSPLL